MKLPVLTRYARAGPVRVVRATCYYAYYVVSLLTLRHSLTAGWYATPRDHACSSFSTTHTRSSLSPAPAHSRSGRYMPAPVQSNPSTKSSSSRPLSHLRKHRVTRYPGNMQQQHARHHCTWHGHSQSPCLAAVARCSNICSPTHCLEAPCHAPPTTPFLGPS